MGNSNVKYDKVEELENAKLYELQDLDLKRYVAYGNTAKEALNNLVVICRENGIPEPRRVGNVYICGAVHIPYAFQYKMRSNPVWFRERNGFHSVCVYYSDL